ncbi:DsbA family protein [Sunxiuqinia rutila]|uniref:DsbA family protein n=1 Tax=Sunxiuqinia rutila TaxID=1397841 RepID=UPI003D363180
MKPFTGIKIKNDMEEKRNNPLVCDPVLGVCGLPEEPLQSSQTNRLAGKKPVKIICFSDPICSFCWGIEPQLRKLMLEYGDEVELEYRMGGLLPDWNYNRGGISKPSDVAHHWDELSSYFDMPIDGDIWLEDPLHSSFPPSVAFKAAQLQDETRALQFLRRLREMVFVQKKNIARWETMAVAAQQSGLDVDQLQADVDGQGEKLFARDRELARELGVKGFPTLLISGEGKEQHVIIGFKPYEMFEKAVVDSHPEAVKKDYDQSWNALFDQFPTLTTREFTELSGQSREASEALLQQLADQQELEKTAIKSGVLWTRKQA